MARLRVVAAVGEAVADGWAVVDPVLGSGIYVAAVD